MDLVIFIIISYYSQSFYIIFKIKQAHERVSLFPKKESAWTVIIVSEANNVNDENEKVGNNKCKIKYFLNNHLKFI